MLRGFGILLHVSSLPGGCHVGDLGPEAYKFVDFLADAEATYWQILPLGHTLPEHGNSPYSAASILAGEPAFISLDLMAREGLLARSPPKCAETATADYDAAWGLKRKYLEEAFAERRARREFQDFLGREEWWVLPYGRFMALLERYGLPWTKWPYSPGDVLPRELEERALFYAYVQHVFWSQWEGLRSYANSRGVFIIGDLPIYPSFDSVDVWWWRKYFKLSPTGEPLYVSGVPPDYFSPTGQL